MSRFAKRKSSGGRAAPRKKRAPRLHRAGGELIVVALGGNALARRGDSGTYEEMRASLERAASRLANLEELGHRIVITHGNGPQVGSTLLRHEAGRRLFGVPALPMNVCVAETQGSVGYMIQQALRSELKRRGSDTVVVTLVTRVIVDAHDPELRTPRKPVGKFLTKREVERMRKENPTYAFARDRARGGWRRVVPSPDPVRIAIAEQECIRLLVDSGFIVVACGGGGIPTVEERGWRGRGIEAVIDKDLAAERLATLIRADRLVILTDVDAACLRYNTPEERKLRAVKLAEARRYLAEGQFGEGSMAPKVLAAIRFVENGGTEAAIGELSQIAGILAGRSGTRITR